MGIYEGSIENLKCKDCYCDLTLEQYRRKVPRCDECHSEAMFWSPEMDMKVNAILAKNGGEKWLDEFLRRLRKFG